ncbi:MAG TPA: serine hydrolase domain-containing protein [Gemmatimonadaceae bacterium]
MRGLAVSTFVALSSATMVGAQVSDSVARRIDAVYAQYNSPSAPGCVVGVFQNNKITYQKGYGSANIEYDVPITPNTPFIMGSVSKQFTAAAIALLIEEGRIKPTDDIHQYVPELRDYGKVVTIDHLVHHTSGIRDFWTLVQAADMRNDDGYAVSDVLELASRQKNLNFDPGAEYNYSNTGYVLLGIVVQRVTGKTLRQFAAERIFTPLGMTHSHFHDDHTEPAHGRAYAYSPAKNGWKINVWANDIVGQGGLMTTIADLQKWDENFYTGKVGGKAFLTRQLDQGVLNNGTKIAYAYGLEVAQYRGLSMVEHSGSTGGYRTDIARFPAQHTSVATMCNVSTANSVGLAHAVADVVLQPVLGKAAAVTQTGAANREGAALSYSDNALARLVGNYQSDELDATFAVTKSGSSLLLKRPRSAPDTLHATATPDAFRVSGLTLRFDVGERPATTFTVDAGRARGIEFRRVAPSGR